MTTMMMMMTTTTMMMMMMVHDDDDDDDDADAEAKAPKAAEAGQKLRFLQDLRTFRSCVATSTVGGLGV